MRFSALLILCVTLCEVCFCPPVCLFMVLSFSICVFSSFIIFYTSICTAFVRIHFSICIQSNRVTSNGSELPP